MNSNADDIPDFSGDDLIHEKGVQEERAARKAKEQFIKSSLSVVRHKLELEESSHRNFDTFSIFNSHSADILRSFRSKARSYDLIVSLVQYTSSFPTPRNANTGTDEYLFGYLKLKKKFPKTLICKETIKDKIVELFFNAETDFKEYEDFSKKFYVITQDSKALSAHVKFKKLDELIAFPEMEVEIHENMCLFRNSRQAITPEIADEFSELTKVLIRILH